VRSLTGVQIASRQLRLVAGRRHVLTVALPQSLRAGAYRVTVRAASPPVESAKTVRFRLR
jgi:methionine-rich copper-binding protein CopC